MKPKKLTSVRLDEVIIQKADEFVAKHRYWKRSDVINNLLLAALLNFSEVEVYEMVKAWEWRSRKVNTKFEKTEEYVNPKF